NGEISVVINTPLGKGSYSDGIEMRTAAVQHGVPVITTMSGAAAAVEAIAVEQEQTRIVTSLQELHS
ncbi:MAG: hypothetical protein AAFX94_21475, partial [Myxococcota bacterium]